MDYRAAAISGKAMLLRATLLLGALTLNSWGDTLAGKVVEDHSNNPLASAELRVYRLGQRQLAAHLETGPSGSFTAEGLAQGDYRIETAKPNYIGTTVRLSTLSGNLVIRLVRCGVISGQVLNAQGQPVPGASVYAMPKPADGSAPRPFASARQGVYSQVNARGQYRIHSLAPGEYAIAVSYGASTAIFGSTGGGSASAGVGSGVQLYPTNSRPQFFAVAGGEEYRNIDFAIIPNTLYSISGKVDLPDPKTKYWLALSARDQPALASAVASTAPDGSFQFEGIGSGAYTLTASGPVTGYGGRAILGPEPLFGRTQVSVGGSNVEGVTLALQKGRSLSLILQSTGTGCPANAQATLIPLEDWAAAIDRSAELNPQMPQTVDHLAPARYQVVVSRLGDSCYQPGTAILDLSSGIKDGPVTVAVAPAGSINGKLTGTMQPAAFVIALLSSDASTDAQPVQVVYPDAAGRFVFGSLRPGPYRISVQPLAEASKGRWVSERARMIEIQIAAGSPTEMELPAPVSRSQ